MSSSSPNKGFTLIEVMITVAILAFISLGIFQATTSSFRLRGELSDESDFYTGIRLAMGIMNKDIMTIYSPTLLLSQDQLNSAQNPQQNQTQGGSSPSSSSSAQSQFDESEIPAATAADLARSFTFWSAAFDKSGLRPSRFFGTDNKMTFVTANHFRIYKDSPESVFAKVTYSVSTDSGPPINGFKVPDSNVLIKETSANVFEMDDMKDRDTTHKFTLIRGIKSCHFTYYRWEDNSFKKFNSWDSDKEDFHWQIPDMIQIDLEILGASGNSYTGFYQFKPELPFHGLNPSF